MAESGPGGCRVLIAEDEYLIASDLARAFRDVGAAVVGPVPTVVQAMTMSGGDAFDIAVLDVKLDGKFIYSLADRLNDAGVPFVFVTGYDASALPARFANVVRFEKPADADALARAVTGMVPK